VCSYLDFMWIIYLYAEADMKRELERKKNPKVEFTAAGSSISKIPGIVKVKQSHVIVQQIVSPAS
jgi:hypothetical protein